MKLSSAGLAVGVFLAAIAWGSDASRLYDQGRAAEKAGHYTEAYVLYSKAAALEPSNQTYWFRSQAVRSRAALETKPTPKPELMRPYTGEGPLPEIGPKDLAEAKNPQPRVELKATAGSQDFDLRGDARTLFENVARAFGLNCVFDTDYPAGRTIPFRIQSADYRLALRAVEASTGSFIVPLTPKVFLVAKDTPQKRNELEPFVSVMVEIPSATTTQEATEVARAVQQALALDRVGLDSQRNVVIFRGPVSKIEPARRLFDDLIHHHPQVSMELEFLEVNRTDFLNYGLKLPTSFPIQNFNTLAGLGTQLSKLAINGMAYGLAIGEARALAQMSNSIGRSLFRLQLRSEDNQPASLHVGDRYPVLTSGYFGSLSSSGTNDGTAINTSSPSTGTNGTTPSTPPTFGNVPGPAAVVSADFNQDGIPDLAAAASGGNEVAVLLGKGDGTFKAASTFPTGTNPSAVAFADLNGDGFWDLVTADAGANGISILLGKGDGTFQATTALAAGTKPAAVVIADFNKDGFPDIAVANADSNNLSILLGHGDGTFAAPLTQPAGTSPRSLVVRDFNGDGVLDLAVANFSSNDLWILLGNGDGTFRQAYTYPTGNSPRDIAAATLTIGGSIDLVVANSASNTVSVFLGQGNGKFLAGTQFQTGSGPVSVAIGDHNSDGLPDISVANYADNTVSLLLGLGNGTFQAPIAFPVGTGPDWVINGDFNRDGLADMVVANFSSNDFSILLGSGNGAFHDTGGTFFPSNGGTPYTPPPSFNFEDLGLSVKLTPHIHGMDEVTLDVEAEIKLLTGQSINGVPVIAHRKVGSQVRLRTGQWGLAAGLISSSEARSIAGIAGLSSLPAIGALTKQTNRNRDSSDVLVLIKTNLLSLPPDQFITHPILIGSETRPITPL